MNKLQMLIDQTSFLFDHQKQALTDCESMFDDLLATVNTQAAKTSPETDEGDALVRIAVTLKEQADRMVEDASQDVAFLAEQLEALKKVAVVNDPVKRSELFALLVEEGEEIKDTAEFKQMVLDESAASKESLSAMLSDIKEAINEGNVSEVAEYLESVFAEENDEDDCCDNEDGDCDCDDEDEDGCSDDEESEDDCGDGACGCKDEGAEAGSCGSCNGCGDGGGCGSKAVDIFANLKEYEQSMLDKVDDKTQH